MGLGDPIPALAIRKWKRLEPGTDIAFVRGERVYHYHIISRSWRDRSIRVAYKAGRIGETIIKDVPHWLAVGAIRYVPKDAR